jgi:sugar lactone lactonase YvrE
MATAQHGRINMTFRLTRRHMLASAAAGGAAFSTGLYGVASAQSVKRIEQFAPELDKIIGTGESINQLADGVGGDNGPAEGPVWWKEGGYLLFSDINGNRRMKYTPGQGTVEFKKPTNGANGLTRDLQGRLVACEGAGRRVIREEPDDSRRRHIRAFDMAPSPACPFAQLGGAAIDVPSGSGGLWILDSKGKKLGRIIHGQPQTTNLAFGGPDWKTVYFTNWNFLGSLNLRIAGMPVPAIKKA